MLMSIHKHIFDVINNFVWKTVLTQPTMLHVMMTIKSKTVLETQQFHLQQHRQTSLQGFFSSLPRGPVKNLSQ